MPGMEGLDAAAMTESLGADTNIDLAFIDLTVAHHQDGKPMAQAAQMLVVSENLWAMATTSASLPLREFQQIRYVLPAWPHRSRAQSARPK